MCRKEKTACIAYKLLLRRRIAPLIWELAKDETLQKRPIDLLVLRRGVEVVELFVGDEFVLKFLKDWFKIFL
jgi:hypothetical protein